eukprot:gb/GFBE01061075.1/.p1 GENE.gb/GFBE01061075.1/~~gb/GFBE01061075.1/.p1  ORF type:complete len:948 (+),score=229.41 gb/GFBE01061075.1/:1-2844(+)
MAFAPGMLVEISGLQQKAEAISGAALDSRQSFDLNGARAQLVQYDRTVSKWVAATFDGQMIAIEERFIRLLCASELKAYDLVLGPKSDFDVSGRAIIDSLANKGYASVKLLVAEDDASAMHSIASQLDKQGNFSRLAVEFARGYLGRNGSHKTMQLSMDDPDIPETVKESPLRTMDENFSHLSDILSNYTDEALGFDIYSRTDLLLRMPLSATEQQLYPAAKVEEGDAESHMHLMYRKQITAMQFVGPASGTIRLIPMQSDAEEVVLTAEPHTILLLLSNHWEYSYEAEGESLTLQTFFLSKPGNATFVDFHGGDLDLFEGVPGPAAPSGEHISVVGMACRYGTGSDCREKLWAAVAKAATDGLGPIPKKRWDNDLYLDLESTGGMYCKHGCFGIENIEMFDNKFFEVSAMEAQAMDPMQRQVMEISYMALLEGGYDKSSLMRSAKNIGHYCGVDKVDWLHLGAVGTVKNSGSLSAAAAATSIISNRFSFQMNLKGPSMTIDTACSASLVCSHVSKLALRDKSSEIEPVPATVVNGINTLLSPAPYVACAAAGMLSHDGRCFTFNQSADGYARGELGGALCFRNQQFDPDEGSLCLLAGSHVNQDGRSASLTAPNGPSQEKAIKSVIRECGLMPSEVDCLECHGTGTALGDPIEVGSIRKVMSSTPREVPMLFSSSKSNIGHGEGGAGLAGFFKCCLQVAHCEGAPNVHLSVRNPHIELEGFPSLLVSEGIPMNGDSAYSGVSSFGFGGTNAHAEAWGKNVMSSRGTLSADLSKEYQKRVKLAPNAVITMKGDDVKDWQTTGVHPGLPEGTQYRVHVDSEGKATWQPVDVDEEDWGDEFALRGSFSDWELQTMHKHDSIDGLWAALVTIGASGEEEFQVVADEDEEKVYYPSDPRCTSRAALVRGPAAQDVAAEGGKAWLVRGEPGSKVRIEFFHQKTRRSVMWLKV